MKPSIPITLAILALAIAPARAAEPPISLAEAIAEAQVHNPDTVLARRRITLAGAAITQADAMVWPKLALRSSYQRTDNPVGVFGTALNQRSFHPGLDFNNVPAADNLNVAGVVTAPLFTGGRIPAEREAAREMRAAGTHALAAVQNQLAFEVARTFFTIQKSRAFIEAAEAAVHNFEENLTIARKQLEAGKALRADVLDIEVRLAQSREELVQARNANELARHALANLLGREGELPDVTADTPPMPTPAETTQPHRPELDALRRQHTAAQAAIRSARAGFKPTVRAFATAEHNHGWQFNGNGDNYTAGLRVDWNLWDGFLTRGKVDEARAKADIVHEQQRRLRLAIGLEVQQARLNLKAATERVTVSGKAVELAAESVQLTRVRFEQGLALATQLIDAETALTGARVRLAQAESDQHIAVAALRKALGLPQLETATHP